MSSFKQLNKADVTTVPYAANKRWVWNSNTSNSNFNFFRGTYITGTFSPSEPSFNGQYERLIYDSINHMFYQSYNGSVLDTGSLMFNLDTYESASQQRPTGSYFNYNTNPNLIKNFPTGAGAVIKVLAVSPTVYGSKILPTSFKIQSGSAIKIVDDGYGNLFDVAGVEDDYVLPTWPTVDYFLDPTPNAGITPIGNIFYAHGLVVITDQSSSYQSLTSITSSISFQNEHIVYENEVRCIVRESDFNLSYNPSLVSGSYENGILKDFTTGSLEFSGSYSVFQPYVTTIGLYNDNNDLLMVAKLAKPIALSSDTDMTFIVRYDT